MQHDVFLTHRRNSCSILHAPTYIIPMYIVAMVLQRTHIRTLSNYRLNRCKPFRRRFNERVVTWKLCVVASSTPMFTIGVVIHFPWKRYRNYVPGFGRISHCSSEETTLFCLDFMEDNVSKLIQKNNFLTWFFTFSEPENNVDINFIMSLSNVIFNTLF